MKSKCSLGYYLEINLSIRASGSRLMTHGIGKQGWILQFHGECERHREGEALGEGVSIL